jgi:predicted SAM-dependent methyltransferase
MARNWIDKITRAVAWLRRKQRVVTYQNPVKVNLGSGLTVAPGWINLDGSLSAFVSAWPRVILNKLYEYTDSRQWYTRDQYIRILASHRFVYHQLEHGLPFEDGSIDYIYSSHMLEHLYREEAFALLKEAYRALKKGGRIRIAVPDLAIVVNLYQGGRKKEALDYFFSESRGGALNCHRYMYDFDLLRGLLESAGFIDVEHCSYRIGKVPDIEQLDNRPEETLYIEAVK